MKLSAPRRLVGSAWRRLERLARWARRQVTRFAACVRTRAVVATLRLGAALLFIGSAVVVVAQPTTEPTALDGLVAIAGLLAIVLSLGITVTFLVAQHTAEGHAQALYAEFRHERAWLVALGSLGAGLVAIVAASIVAPTISTPWAALALATALGAFAASLFPRMLDSLDRTELSRRITARIVAQLGTASRRTTEIQRENTIKPIARHGIELTSGLASEGISSSDREVVRAGFAGVGRVYVVYVEGSPTLGWDGEIVNYMYHHLEALIDVCVSSSPVILLPPALEELTALAEAYPKVARPWLRNENFSGRLNRLFFDVAAKTLTMDSSGAAAMAVAGIGSGGVELVRSDRPNGAIDHIRKLRAVGKAAIASDREHIAGQANHELAHRAGARRARVPQDHARQPVPGGVRRVLGRRRRRRGEACHHGSHDERLGADARDRSLCPAEPLSGGRRRHRSAIPTA